MKYVVGGILVLAIFVAGLMVGCERTKAQAAVAYSRLAHAHDAAIAELKSERDVAAEVPALKDSIAHYKGKAILSTRIVLRRDTVAITDTLLVGTPADSLTSIADFPPAHKDGITVRLRLAFVPPIPPTKITRYLGVTVDPDTVSLLLLRQPDGLVRVLAAVERETGLRLQVVDAAMTQAKSGKRLGVGCTLGPSVTMTPGGRAYAGAGVTCGVQLRF